MDPDRHSARIGFAAARIRPGAGVWGVVPVKSFAQAKQRLAPGFDRAFRAGLAAAMAEDVLRALAAVPELSGLVVVSEDPDAASLAERYGACVLRDQAGAGHTAAVTAAARILAEGGCASMLVLPGDVPLITAAEISRLLRAHPPGRSFTIVPDHDCRGSNAILCSPPDAVPLSFGLDSFSVHCTRARGCGLALNVMRSPGLELDVDHPDDFHRVMRRLGPSFTARFVEGWGNGDAKRAVLCGGGHV